MGKVKSVSRPSALVRAEHGGAPVRLSREQRQTFEEALRLGADLADELQSKVVSYGRWLLDEVFANDAGAALDRKTKNPVWLELVRRAGGPTLPISRHMLYVALQLAAYDKRITDQTWRGLDAGRKELLLPLAEDRRLRDAAAHVSKFNLTQTKTREYVTGLLAEEGKSRQVRLTGTQLVTRLRKMREGLGAPAVLRRVKSLRGELEPEQRQEVAAEIDQLREVLATVARELRGK